MVTVKQKRAAKSVVSGGTPTQAMRDAGYAPSMVRKPAELTRSKGFKEALAEYGLTEELITKSLVSDIEAKPAKRVKELALGAEILGMKERDPVSPTIINIDLRAAFLKVYGRTPDSSGEGAENR